MKVALISDTHGMLPEIPAEAEAVIHAGDVCPDNYLAGRHQLAWLREVFSPWAEKVNRDIFLTWGNHDFVGERLPEDQIYQNLPGNVFIGNDTFWNIGGKKVWFSPWSNLFGDWAFMRTEDGLTERYALIPDDTQIMVSHGPPAGYGDVTYYDIGDGGAPKNVGSQVLLERCKALPDLELLVCGHIHGSRGTYSVEREHFGGIIELFQVMNVSCVDEAYKPIPNGPVLVDL